jgi:hypothetical protein
MRILVVAMLSLIITIIMPDSFNIPEPSSFTNDQKPLFSFGIISDAQYCDCDPAGTRYYRSSLLKLEEAVRSFRIDSPQFVVDLGDLIEKDLKSYKPVFRILDTAGFKIYHLGNYGNLNMIHFVTMRGMVETEENNSFALIEVYKDKIWIKGNGREKSQILAY